MNLDISLAISIVAVCIPFLAALTDRKKVHSDITTQIVENVQKSILLREADIAYLEKNLAKCYIEKKHLQSYINFLWDWILQNAKTPKRPKTFEKFVLRKDSRWMD